MSLYDWINFVWPYATTFTFTFLVTFFILTYREEA